MVFSDWPKIFVFFSIFILQKYQNQWAYPRYPNSDNPYFFSFQGNDEDWKQKLDSKKSVGDIQIGRERKSENVDVSKLKRKQNGKKHGGKKRVKSS